MAVKTQCPISRAEFAKDAPVLEAVVAGIPVLLEPREFSTGSLGFYGNPKITVVIGGKRVQCQCQVQITVAGSKDLPQ